MSEGKFSNTQFEIETSRLRLRPINPDDLDALCSIVSEPEVLRYLYPGAPMQREEVEIALHSMIAHWERHGFGRLAVINKDNGKMIGYSGLRALEGKPEIIYTIAKQYWGEGFATEAAKASMKFGFETLQFERIVAITKPDNWVSRHILEKIGFCFQGEGTFYGQTVASYEIARRHYIPDENFFCRISYQQTPDLSGQNSVQPVPQVF